MYVGPPDGEDDGIADSSSDGLAELTYVGPGDVIETSDGEIVGIAEGRKEIAFDGDAVCSSLGVWVTLNSISLLVTGLPVPV